MCVVPVCMLFLCVHVVPVCAKCSSFAFCNIPELFPCFSDCVVFGRCCDVSFEYVIYVLFRCVICVLFWVCICFGVCNLYVVWLCNLCVVCVCNFCTVSLCKLCVVSVCCIAVISWDVFYVYYDTMF